MIKPIQKYLDSHDYKNYYFQLLRQIGTHRDNSYNVWSKKELTKMLNAHEARLNSYEKLDLIQTRLKEK